MEAAIAMYLKSVKATCPALSERELMLFASKLTLKEFRKKEIFLQAGSVQKALGFIVQGLVRSFYIDDQGNEITVGFYKEGDYATHYPAFIARQQSHYTIQCLEPAQIFCLSYEDQQGLYSHSPAFERYGRLISDGILIQQQARIESFIFQTAEQRYLDFMKYSPGVFNRVSLSHLCSFLGIERQSLTRIRQRLLHH